MKDYKGVCLFIPVELHKKFRLQLLKDNLTIKEAFLGFIREYVKEGKNVNNKKSTKRSNKETKKT